MTHDPGSALLGRFERVLIAEDNTVLSRALMRLVASWGSHGINAETRASAIAHMDDGNSPAFCLIVCDVRFPDGTGCAVFERARQLSPAPLMVAISGRASGREGFELGRLGVHAYLEKPFDADTFEQTVVDAVANRALSAAHQGAALLSEKLRVDLQRYAERNALSEQQVEILRLSVAGVSRKELSRALGVSENTCKTTVRRLLQRCRASRLTDITRALVANGAAQK